MTAGPAAPGVNPGGSVDYAIELGAVQGFTGPVHLSVAGLPAAATATFADPDPVPPATTTLTVHTDVSTPLGLSTLAITGTDGGTLTHTADVALYVTDVVPGTGAIDIDFVGGGTAMGAAELAGVAARPNWNEAAGANGPGLALVDETGVDSGAAVAWSAPGVWTLGIADVAGDFRMMNGYLDAMDADVATVTVTGLPADPSGHYVYVYADGDNDGDMRTGSYTIAGPGTPATTIDVIDEPNTDFDGSFVRARNGAGNYAVFFVGGSDFTLTATPATSGGGTLRAPLNAIQIVRGDRIFAGGFEP
jgi:hypothetical protein